MALVSGTGSRIGCDVGGTFTDLVIWDEATGRLDVRKVLTTPDDPSRAILAAVDTIDAPAAGQMIHGTTLVINALVERRGAPTALLTTRGFRDVLQLRRHTRADVFDIQGEVPVPLIPRHWRREVDERIWSDGRVLQPVALAPLRQEIEPLVEAGCESIAVCLIHAYRNAAHEAMIGDFIRREWPQLTVSLSSQVLPEIQEYERTSTTAANAYVQPLIRRYLERLRSGLGARKLFMMLSSGGISSVETAIAFPVRLVESGPVAGMIAAQHFARIGGMKRVLALDIGGTTAKACVVDGTTIPKTSQYEVLPASGARRGSGIPLATPTVDIIETGAGGGSLATINMLGSLQIGPHSAGAKPGPACYGLGGEIPTVTDANLVLGYLNPDYFLGGAMALQPDLAEAALNRAIANPLDVPLDEAAWAVHNLANKYMAADLRTYLAERGVEPESCTLIAFGGGGPLHACHLARKLRIDHVVIPPRPGVFSALGLLVAPPSYDIVRTLLQPVALIGGDQLTRAFGEIIRQVEAVLRQVDGSGPITHRTSIGVRYRGQGYELDVPVSLELGEEKDPAVIAARFNQLYGERYGQAYAQLALEMSTIRVAGTVHRPIPEFQGVAAADAPLAFGRRRAHAGGTGWAEFRTVSRYALSPGVALAGPLIVEERESSTIVPADGTLTMDAQGSLHIHLNQGSDHGC